MDYLKVVTLAGMFLWSTVAASQNSCLTLFTAPGHGSQSESGAAAWMQSVQSAVSLQKVLENISPADGLPGAIIAGRTRSQPDYYFHWIRDAAIVIEAVLPERASTGPQIQRTIEKKVGEYFTFSERIQRLKTPGGLGEPKVNVDGTAFLGNWGRPQNDSPALRALSLIHLESVLPRATAATLFSAIKLDLDYVSQHWFDPTYDLWEEVKGLHFYTWMVQRRALLAGARFMENNGDLAAAALYHARAQSIEGEIKKLWDGQQGFFFATKPGSRVEGIDNKLSNIDVSVVLGLLHGGMGDGFLSFSSSAVLSTLARVEDAFKNLYAINKVGNGLGVAIGRYPEDTFSGPDRSGGNPWVLATLGMAEAYYRAAQEVKNNPTKIADYQFFLRKGDSFVSRVQFHTNQNGSLSEQIQRDTGGMTSVDDLTWSHAALLTAARARLMARPD